MISDNMSPIGPLIKRLMELYGFDKVLKEREVLDAWPEVVGKVFAKYTASVELKNGTLYVKMNSPAARNEMFNNRVEIRERLNNIAGSNMIREMVIR